MSNSNDRNPDGRESQRKAHERAAADGLDRQMQELLRRQPLRRAPAGLAERVLTQIEARRARPWWRNSFAYWPAAARCAFLIVSIGFVRLGWLMTDWLDGPIGSGASDLTARVAWIPSVLAALGSVFQSIPPLWMYGGIALLAALYAMLFGVGAAAYRTLYAPSR